MGILVAYATGNIQTGINAGFGFSVFLGIAFFLNLFRQGAFKKNHHRHIRNRHRSSRSHQGVHA